MSNTNRRQALRAEQAKQRGRDRRILALVAVGIVVLLVAGGIGFQAWRTSQGPSGVPSASTSATPVQLVNGQPVVFGRTNAPVQITLYADFHCPGCAEFEKNYAGVLATAQQNGRAAIRFYPLTFHDPGSVSAGNGFACAAEAGFGQTYFAGLFANASLEWNNDQLITLAEQASGTPATAAFRSCVTDRPHLAWLESITDEADRSGVTRTPTVLLNGAAVDLATTTPDALAQQIDAAAS